ncbi:DUF1214 domain-containing protein [Bradyrhizobium cenepequi]|uniref:DUF1214 domain-containing protein n=1 Tax=Bradyrhizobium cenepequi TaxID=2821403 RepID=UPI0028A1EA09|nr:DUF1214 domain-containing protein [Bradyrhizobium cenepequi]
MVRDIPVDGFWSLTVYNGEGYLQPNPSNACAVNSVTAKQAPDGSVTLQFGGCDGKNPTACRSHQGGIILHGAYVSPAIRNPRWHLEIPGGVACELSPRRRRQLRKTLLSTLGRSPFSLRGQLWSNCDLAGRAAFGAFRTQVSHCVRSEKCQMTDVLFHTRYASGSAASPEVSSISRHTMSALPRALRILRGRGRAVRDRALLAEEGIVHLGPTAPPIR